MMPQTKNDTRSQTNHTYHNLEDLYFQCDIWNLDLIQYPSYCNHHNQTKIYYHPDLKAYNPQNTPF